MMVFSHKRLAILAVPKTGSTALQEAIGSRADIIFAKWRKHINTRQFNKHVAPFLNEIVGTEVKTLAVMREPLDHLSSWYRYRSRRELEGTDRSTSGMSFDAFLDGVLAQERPEYARFGSQHNFLRDSAGELNVDHLFAYERQDILLDYLSNRFGHPITLEQHNVSPKFDTPLSAPSEARLREGYKEEFALYEKLMAAGGYLKRD